MSTQSPIENFNLLPTIATTIARIGMLSIQLEVGTIHEKNGMKWEKN